MERDPADDSKSDDASDGTAVSRPHRALGGDSRSGGASSDVDEPHAGGLTSMSFVGLLMTQFLTAVNDNIFRWLAIGIGKDYVPRGEHGRILMAGTACFVLPYILFAAPAGYLADRFRKRDVIVACKVAEIVLVALGILAIVWGSMFGLFAVVAACGAQSALFAPSKLGAIPELLKASKIPAANAFFGVTTVAATIVGMAIGCVLKDATGRFGQTHWWMSASAVLAVAVVGTGFSLLIRAGRDGDAARRFPWNAALETARDLRTLYSIRALFRVALGLVFFWALGAFAQLNIDQFAFEAGATTEFAKTPLLAGLVIGVAAGSALAGALCHGRIELGLLPIGAGGVAISSMFLFLIRGDLFDPTLVSPWSAGLISACALLFLLGTSAGLFSVPLESYVQHRSPPESRGSILAATNFLVFSGVLVFSILFYVLRFPTFPGSFEAIDANLRDPPTERSRIAVADAERAFHEAWNEPGDAPRVETFLARVPAEARTSALVHLLWVEIAERGRRRDASIELEYHERFPDDRDAIRAVFGQAGKRPLLSARGVFLLAGLGTWPVLVYVLWLLPQASVRFIVWFATHTLYRIRLHGAEHLPRQGGCLLAANHVSWADGILLLVTSSRPIRFIVYAGNFDNRFLLWLGKLADAILISSKPKAIASAIRQAREALRQGEIVCIFPEGGITRTGQVQGFKPGVMKILEGARVPVVPVYLDGLWGSIFSFERGRFFWKWPRKMPYPVAIHFGPPIHDPKDVFEIRQAVQALGAQAVQSRSNPPLAPPRNMIRRCKKYRFRGKVADSTGAELTGGALLMRSLIFRRLLRRGVLRNDETHVGLLLPPACASVVANAALALDRRVACNLNYTVTSDVINACIRQANIRHVLTSRKFMEKFDFQLDAELVFLEDFKDRVSLADKLIGGLHAFATPAPVLEKLLGLSSIKADDVLTVIFTSGSTGMPKGVMLTHANVATNTDAVDQVVRLRDNDVVIGILPFFHSFGYTISMWTVLNTDVRGAYHFSPLDAKQIGKLCRTQRGTILLSTPTFLRSFLRRIDKEDFASLDVVVAGAEKLPQDLSDAFEQRFGVRPVEGYGTTELSPLVSVNVPPSRSADNFQETLREGSVGRPVPDVSAKIVHPETGDPLGVNQDGMLLIKGPNVMKGYLGQDEATRKVIQDGWYVTGDIAHVDEDGFIHITGRESRFSKIGGEMVPHIQVEEELNRLLGADDEGGLRAVVTSVSDERKGERLIVLHLPISRSPEDLRKGLTDRGLPNIFIPANDSFFQVDELPILGSGKLDLKRIKALAEQYWEARGQG